MENTLIVPQGQFQLQRLPYRKQQLLRAWDAADEYLLNHFAKHCQPDANAKLVIVNDSFGALAVALADYQPIAISDSYLSQQATLLNLAANQLDAEQVVLLDSLSVPEAGIDYLLIKAPKTLALLEYQLHRLRPLLKPSCTVIVAGMVKNLPPTLWKILERLIGPTKPSIAVKKARMIFAEFDPTLVIAPNPYPTVYQLEGTELAISNHANVFSRDSLDIGTRFLLQHLPTNPAYRDFIDLGCGNGLVGLSIARQLPEANICFVDESFMALASAKQNFAAALSEQGSAEFIAADCLNGFDANSADCVVCNPPFHQQHTVGDHIAWQMFQQAHKVLRAGGELRVIGNRHLNYHLSLKKLFGNCRQIASNTKFVIFSSQKY
jgi:16S rRNA (guanine1207-N2)-methyltransferase